MTQQVRLENGELHYFPDDATPDEINSALASQAAPQNVSNYIPFMASPWGNMPINLTPAQAKTAAITAGGIGLGAAVPAAIPEELAMLGGEGVLGGALRYAGRTALDTGIGAISAALSPNKKEDTTAGKALSGATETAPVAAALEALPGGLGVIGKALEKVMPQVHVGNIMDNITGGVQNLKDNAKLFADKVVNKYNQFKTESKNAYESIFNNPVLDRSESYLAVMPREASQFNNLSEDTLNAISKNPNLKDAIIAYTERPGFLAAHRLQSKLGEEQRNVTRAFPSGLPSDEATYVAHLKRAQDAIAGEGGDLPTALQKIDLRNGTNLAPSYDASQKYFYDNVVPYRSHAMINDLVERGKPQNFLSNISSIFKQTPRVDPNIEKVVSDIEGAPNHIIANELLKSTRGGKPNAEKLLEKGKELGSGNSGFSQYMDPTLDEQFNALKNSVGWRSVVSKTAGGLAGLMAAHGLPPLAKATSAMGGALASPIVGKAIQSPGGVEHIRELLNLLYRPGIAGGISAVQQ